MPRGLIKARGYALGVLVLNPVTGDEIASATDSV